MYLVFCVYLFVSTVYSPLLLYTVVVFVRRMLALLFNLCVVHFFCVSINDDDDDEMSALLKSWADKLRCIQQQQELVID